MLNECLFIILKWRRDFLKIKIISSKLSRKFFGRMEQFRWLLFLETNKTSEELFRAVYIPFNCGFLLARRLKGGDQMQFSEVYRTQPEYLLEENTLALSDTAKSFNVYYKPMFHRRRDLKGRVLKAGTRKVFIYVINFALFLK